MLIHNEDNIIVEMAAHLDTPAVIRAALYIFSAQFSCVHSPRLCLVWGRAGVTTVIT